MSVKIYDINEDARGYLEECANGRFVLHTDYAALLARHNELWNFYAQLEQAMFEYEKEARECRLKQRMADNFKAQYKRELEKLLTRHNALVEAVTPSAETKIAYMGEFSFCISEFDDDGEEFARVMDVPWTTIKKIMKAIAARAEVGRLL